MKPEERATEAHAAIHAIYGIESPRLIARLIRIVRDLGVAEELAHDALLVALDRWPEEGVPDNPGAWLMTTGKRLALNAEKRRKLGAKKLEALGHELDTHSGSGANVEELHAALDDDVADELLRLVFLTCHPVLTRDARVALTLRLLGGLTTEEIARAFLVPEPTIAQRIVRAKRTLTETRAPFELPPRDELSARLASVLEVVYLVFNEGYAATRGDDVMRPSLCEDALRLGRILAALAPEEPEAHGLIALMELHASRAPARSGPTGEPILLLDQDRGRWDQLLLRRGLAALARAESLRTSRGPYTLQAAISACHARARLPGDTDFARIAALYGELSALRPSPIVELNRAVAVAMAEGPLAGLAILDGLRDEPSLRSYHLFPSARADLLFKLGRAEEAKAEFERAASLTDNVRQRKLLQDRADECARSSTSRSPSR